MTGNPSELYSVVIVFFKLGLKNYFMPYLYSSLATNLTLEYAPRPIVLLIKYSLTCLPSSSFDKVTTVLRIEGGKSSYFIIS